MIFQKSNRKKYIVLSLIAAVVVLIVLVAAAAFCWFAFSPTAVSGGKTIVVDVTHKDGSTNTYEITTEAELLPPPLILISSPWPLPAAI